MEENIVSTTKRNFTLEDLQRKNIELEKLEEREKEITSELEKEVEKEEERD